MKRASLTLHQAALENQGNPNLRYVVADSKRVRSCKHRIIIIRYAIPAILMKKAAKAYESGTMMKVQFTTLTGEQANWTYVPGKTASNVAATSPIFEEWIMVDGEDWDLTSGDIYEGSLSDLSDRIKDCNGKKIALCINFNPRFADTSTHMGVDSFHPYGIAAMDGSVWISARDNDQSASAKWSRLVGNPVVENINGTSKLLNVAMSHDPNGYEASRFHTYVYHHGGSSIYDSLGCSIATSTFMKAPTTVDSLNESKKLTVLLFKAGCPIYDHKTGWVKSQSDFLSSTINVWLTDNHISFLNGKVVSNVAAGGYELRQGPRPDLALYISGRGKGKSFKDQSSVGKVITKPENIAFMVGSLIIGMILGFIGKKIKNSLQGEDNSVEHLDTREVNISVTGLDGMCDMLNLSWSSVSSQYQQAINSATDFKKVISSALNNSSRPGVVMSQERSVVRNGWKDPQCYFYYMEIPQSKVDCLGQMGVKTEPIRQCLLTMKSLVNPNSQIQFKVNVLDGVVESHNAMSQANKDKVINYIKNKFV